jgi:RHS repeat-associated protein
MQSCSRQYWWDGCSDLTIGTKIADFSTSCITDCINGGTFSYCNYSTTQYQVYEICNGTDADGDGYYTLDSCKTPNDDCNDGDATIYPGAEELCDCKDNDCDDIVDEGCCPKITDFKGNNTEINRSTGGSIGFSGTIQTVCDKPVSWTLSVPGRTFSGSGTSVSVTWDGKDSSGKVVKPGTYNATLSATANDCTKTKSKSFTVKELENCNLGVTFKSKANIASGNLSHSQQLFSAKGGALPATMTLHYNSLDPYTGPLGAGWVHNYDIAVEESEGGSVTLRDGAGGYKLYMQTSSGYTSQPGDYSVLSKDDEGVYTITHKDGLKYSFGADGRITSMTDRNGNAVTFAYDSGNLTSVTDPAGRLITLSYDTSNRLTAIIDVLGNTHSFTYSGENLTQVSTSSPQLETSNWIYSYDADSFMQTKTDPNGNTTTYTYDSDHRVLTGTGSEGQSKSMAYAGADAKTATVTETDGGVWQYSYDAEAGTLTSRINPEGNATTYAYDGNRNLLSKTDPDGTTTTYAYDSSGNMTSTTDALGQTTTHTYNEYGQVASTTDPEGNTTSNNYDEKGNLTSITDAGGATTRYEYDSKGNVTSVTNAADQTTTYAYDEKGNPVSITDPTGATTSFTYDAAGNMTSQTDANGNTTRYEYNSLNQLQKVIDPNGNATSFTYDKNGNKTKQTDANGNTTTYEYNASGQLIKVTDALGNVAQYTYGGSGCSSCGGGGENIASITDANGNIINFEYDQVGRKIREIDALGNAISYTYDSKGNVLTRTDANGHVTSYVYDPLGRVREQTNAMLGVVTFEYSSKGQVTKVIDPLGNATEYEYDAAGRVVKVVSPDAGTTSYSYNSTGTMATKTDANGTIIRYQYDNANRLTTIDFPSDDDITYTYDTCANGRGRVCTMADQAGTSSYEYDKLGRMVKEQKTILGTKYATTYAYSATNNVTTITYPSGRVVTHDLDKLNRTTAIKGASALASITYDPASNLESMTFENGLKQTWNYDPNNRISTISLPGTLSLSYIYDPAGNITNIADQLDPTKSKTYTYDPLDRLATAVGPWGTLAWTYDANGNRLSQTNGVHYTYSYQADRPMTVSNGHIDSYQYDQNGNTINDGQKDFVYNQNQRLIKATESGKMIAEYTYNANGQRVIKKTGPASTNSASSQNTVYHYDLSGQLIEETDGNGKLIADYVYLNGKPLAMIRKQSNQDEKFYYHNDHLGTPKLVTDKLKKVVWNVEFDPFGSEVEQKGRKGSYIRNVENNFRFPGQYYDAETGLHQNYYRDYAPTLGRYVEADPIGIEKGRNHLYNYVNSNPVKYTDSLGLKCVLPSGMTYAGFLHKIDSAYHSLIYFDLPCGSNKRAVNYNLNLDKAFSNAGQIGREFLSGSPGEGAFSDPVVLEATCGKTAVIAYEVQTRIITQPGAMGFLLKYLEVCYECTCCP